MADYSFLSIWKFDAPLEKVYNAIHDADNYHLWWKGQSPVETIKLGDSLGVGAVKKFKTRSVLPYSLIYTGTVLEVEPMKKVVGTTVGQLEGKGTWIFEEEKGVAVVKYFWVVKTNSVLMNFFTPVLKHVFEWNHDVVMRWGEEGLSKYLGCSVVRSCV